jgi:hypothetical protein
MKRCGISDSKGMLYSQSENVIKCTMQFYSWSFQVAICAVWFSVETVGCSRSSAHVPINDAIFSILFNTHENHSIVLLPKLQSLKADFVVPNLLHPACGAC